jgi:WD40 repeat protein
VSRQVAGQALRLRATNPALAAQLSLVAYRLAPTTEARGSLLSTLANPYATRLTGHTSDVNSVAFSPGGRILVTASDDTTARLWDISDPGQPRPLGTLTGHTKTVAGVAFSRDGHALATGSADGTARLWEINVDSVAARICSITWPAITKLSGTNTCPICRTGLRARELPDR